MPVQAPPGYRRDALPQHLEVFLAEAAAKTRDRFERDWPHPFLIYTRSKLWDRALLLAPDPRGGDETQVARYELYEGGMSFLHPIRKVQSDPHHPGIVLGRAKNQDLVVPVASISNAHAAFLPPKAGGAADWLVTDLDSRNGTWINDLQVPARETRPVKDGEYLRLGGNLLAWFVSSGHMWELLRRPDELKKYTEV